MNRRGDLTIGIQNNGMPVMKRFETGLFGEETQACWGTGRKSRFSNRGEFGLDSVTWIMRASNCLSIRCGKLLRYGLQMACNKSHMAFLDAITLRNASRVGPMPSSLLCFVYWPSFRDFRWSFLSADRHCILWPARCVAIQSFSEFPG
jgi:hypothetical protein